MDPRYVSALNRDVPLAAPGEFSPLRLGSLSIWPPVVLAPMAGVTNAPFRTLCRRFGGGLYVSEMITARALIDGQAKALRLAGFAPEESPRSLQLYGVDPRSMGEAVRYLVGEDLVDHLDLNFGCPVPKVTRRGGGAALPLRPRLLRAIVRAAVAAAGAVPITLKFRMGIDARRLTYRDSGALAEDEGCAAVALHARTAAQLYAGSADWDAIADLKSRVRSIPVLGNGDIWEGLDALRMLRATGCDGVVIGRGCLGRPWLFRDVDDVLSGREPPDPPRQGEVADLMLEHARLLCRWTGDETYALRGFRKHATWYTKGFADTRGLRARLTGVTTLAELEKLAAEIPRERPFPPEAMRVPRGKKGGTQRVALPSGWLDHPDDLTPPPPEAEDPTSGG
jgi:nifR3 family TIM-barrel protein